MSLPNRSEIFDKARELGFDECRIAPARPAPHADYLREWLDEGRQGSMEWLAREPERRMDPGRVLAGARSLICLGVNSWQQPHASRGRIANYALGDDYHDVLWARLDRMVAWLEQRCGPDHQHRRYVDTGPVLERPLAQEAGLGWQGKSTMLINRHHGTWFLLGEVVTTLQLECDPPEADHCGRCTRCIDACPTGAITGPYQLDARRCLSYLTIENRGNIPEEYRPLVGDRIYGCDDCLEACPWNRFAQTSREARFTENRVPDWDARDFLSLDRQGFNRLFRNSPIKRAKRRGFLRNVCVVLGNIGDRDDLPALRAALDDEEELVREHAAWAIEQIEKRVAGNK